MKKYTERYTVMISEKKKYYLSVLQNNTISLFMKKFIKKIQKAFLFIYCFFVPKYTAIITFHQSKKQKIPSRIYSETQIYTNNKEQRCLEIKCYKNKKYTQTVYMHYLTEKQIELFKNGVLKIQ